MVLKKARQPQGNTEPATSRQVKRLPKNSIRQFDMQAGLPSLSILQSEVQDMWDVLLGRVEPPVNHGVSTLMEVADAYFCRGSEIAALILERERKGEIGASHAHAKFRKGELRLFMEAAKRAADLGSRRITISQIQSEERRLGRGRLIAD